MKHFYYAKQQELLDLIFQFETNVECRENLDLEEWAYAQIADYYEEINLADKALDIIELGLKRHNFSPSLHARKANLLLSNRDEDKALEMLDQAEAYGHCHIHTELLRAKAHTQKCDYEMALCLLHKLKSCNVATIKDLSRIYYQEAFIYEKQEEYEPMFFALREALRLHPDNQEALERLYICLDMCDMPAESVELCWYLIDKNPYSHLAWYNLGHAYYAQFRYKKAVEAFEYSFITNENFAPAYYDCADVCMQISDFSTALSCLKELLQFDKPDSNLLFKMGLCHEQLGELEKARVLYFRALEHHPKHEEVYFHIGECYAREEKWEVALHFYQQAVEIDDYREDFLSSLADVLIRLGRFKEAEPYLISATEILPELSYIWMRLARFYISWGQSKKALSVLADAEEFAYGADLYYSRAACYAQMGQNQTALEALGEGLGENFERHYLFFELAPAMRADKQVQAAIHYYRYD